MDDQTLKNLLQQADATPSAPPRPLSADDLLAAVRRRRALHARTAAVSLAVVVIAVGVLWHMQLTSDQRDNGISNDVVDMAKIPQRQMEPVRQTSHHVDLASLEREAQMHEQIARAVLASPKSENATADSLAADDADLLRVEAARSAAISWQYATYVESDLNDPEAARREYQRVAQRFPGTTWAKLAATSAERLAPTSPPPL